MKLHAFDRILAMTQAHDGAGAVFFGGPGANFKIGGQIFFLDDQGMVAGGCHRYRESLKDGSVVMHDRAGLAVHKVRGTNHAASEGLADGLVSKADAEDRDFPSEVANQIDADTGFTR